jgi:hypothetical protein
MVTGLAGRTSPLTRRVAVKTYYFDAYADPDYYVSADPPAGDEAPFSATVAEGPDGLASVAFYANRAGTVFTLVASVPTEGRVLASALLTSWSTLEAKSPTEG